MGRIRIRLLILTGFIIYILVVISYQKTSKTLPKQIESPENIIVVSNRVPRCGSSLMSNLFIRLSEKTSAFTYVYNDSGGIQHRMSKHDQHALRNGLIKSVETAQHRRVVFVKHVHFFQMKPADGYSFYYINQLRDPIDRSLSNFDYKRYKCAREKTAGGLCRSLRQSAVKMNLDECLLGRHPEKCITKKNGVQSAVSYFCGQSSICDDAIALPTSKEAVSLAKQNVEKYYHHIGLLEYLINSLELLEYTIPAVFTGILQTYRDMGEIHINTPPSKYRTKISNRSREVLSQVLHAEYELYYFIKQRFITRYTDVFKREPIKNDNKTR